ncbi:MAG: hypothetical protein GKR89_13170 [Candidatus Latescibacteria bacterium]|nr:hypothetical protein [Candidatus Latescibacterota bacterium]
MRRWVLQAAGLLIIVLLVRLMRSPEEAPLPGEAQLVEETRLAMGTVVRIRLYAAPEEAQPLLNRAFGEIGRIDSIMSSHSPTSEVRQVEQLAQDGPTRCSPSLAAVLQRGQFLAQETKGAFDPTLGRLTRLWGFPEAQQPPPPAQIDSALAATGYRHVRFAGDSLHVQRAGLRLDLGAGAKGYAVDRAVELLRDSDVVAGLVEAGGDLRFWGEKPDGRPWRFGVQHPRDAAIAVEAQAIGLEALATSGDYEQFFEYHGERFHHLLDPLTGYPARRSVSATVWAATALDADILSTAVFVMGPQRGLEWIEKWPGGEALVFYMEEGRLQHRASSGIENSLKINK